MASHVMGSRAQVNSAQEPVSSSTTRNRACVFCLGESCDESLLQSEEDSLMLYELLCKFFDFEVPPSLLWAFDGTEAIPLCTICLGVGNYLVKLHREIECLNVDLVETATQIKKAVRMSERSAGNGKNKKSCVLDPASQALRNGILQCNFFCIMLHAGNKCPSWREFNSLMI